MALKQKSSTLKGAKKSSAKTRSSSSSSSSKSKNGKPGRPAPSQHKPKPASAAASSSTKRRLPPHARYTEADLKLVPLNGIRPAGVQKPPNRKKGKQFTDDASMRTILALVMAEKEGNIESKMMRARQMEEVREARRVEAEKRAEGKRERIEERKEELKKSRRKSGKGGERKRRASEGDIEGEMDAVVTKKAKKRVSFG